MVKQIVRDIFLFRPAIRASHKSRYPDWKGSAGHTAGEPGTVCWYGCQYDWCKEEYHYCEYGIHRCSDVQSSDYFKA